MTIIKAAYISARLDVLVEFLNENEIEYSNHRDGAEEEEIWVEDISDFNLELFDQEFLNQQEFEEIKNENVNTLIFY